MAGFVASTEVDVAALEESVRQIVHKVDSGAEELSTFIRYHPAVSL